jgi:hypothetical protein
MIAFIRAASPYVNSANISVSTPENIAKHGVYVSAVLSAAHGQHRVVRQGARRGPADSGHGHRILSGRPGRRRRSSPPARRTWSASDAARSSTDRHYDKDFHGREEDVRPVCAARTVRTGCSISCPFAAPSIPPAPRARLSPRDAGAEEKEGHDRRRRSRRYLCAQTAAERGHEVVLYEKENRLAAFSMSRVRCPISMICAAIRTGSSKRRTVRRENRPEH